MNQNTFDNDDDEGDGDDDDDDVTHFQQFSRPGAKGNTFARIPEEPRCEAACVLCQRKDFIEHWPAGCSPRARPQTCVRSPPVDPSWTCRCTARLAHHKASPQRLQLGHCFCSRLAEVAERPSPVFLTPEPRTRNRRQCPYGAKRQRGHGFMQTTTPTGRRETETRCHRKCLERDDDGGGDVNDGWVWQSRGKNGSSGKKPKPRAADVDS